MRIETLFEMKSPYRDDFRIRGYWFGQGEKTLAIVGAMRGDEIQQQYTCARLVSRLRNIEQHGGITEEQSILVVPSCNPFSMNVSKRFWAMDGTDINRMFPGYDKGETTQRVAAAIFQSLQGFRYGVQMASFYLSGNFVPHVRMLQTGYEDPDTARLFGLPFVTLRKPLPFDTTLLNYNWQLWGTKAYSLYTGSTSTLDPEASRQSVDAVLRFLAKTGTIDYRVQTAGYESELMDEYSLVNIIAHAAGIFSPQYEAGAHISIGDTLALILDPYTAEIKERVESPVNGTIFFEHNRPLALEHGIIFRLYAYA